MNVNDCIETPVLFGMLPDPHPGESDDRNCFRHLHAAAVPGAFLLQWYRAEGGVLAADTRKTDREKSGTDQVAENHGFVHISACSKRVVGHFPPLLDEKILLGVSSQHALKNKAFQRIIASGV